MTTQQAKNKPIFPNIPRTSQAVDANGNLTAQWTLALNTLFQTNQQFFSNEGFGLPVLTAEEQQTIEDNYQKYLGSRLPAGVKDITGYRIIDAPTYDGSTPRLPRVFIIEYNSNQEVRTAEWKEYTL